MEKEIKRYPFQFISSDILKLVAIITMLIDHIGAGITAYQYYIGQYPFGLRASQVADLYYILRIIGRIAFPIFCFLLVEGFSHTRNKFKYLRNLCIFAFISEIPFDLSLIDSTTSDFITFSGLIQNIPDYMESQNVYFTLAIGFIVIWIMDYFWSKVVPGFDLNLYGKLRNVATIASFVAIVMGCCIAYALNTDYSYNGILLISIFYLLRRFILIPEIAGYLVMFHLSLEPYSFPAYIMLFLYNGKRSDFMKKLKYFFYAFYPVHLLIIYIVRCLLY